MLVLVLMYPTICTDGRKTRMVMSSYRIQYQKVRNIVSYSITFSLNCIKLGVISTAYDHLRLIRASMDAIELVSCIRFKPRKFAKDFLQIFSGKYCKSHLGRTGGGQPLSLNWRVCFEKVNNSIFGKIVCKFTINSNRASLSTNYCTPWGTFTCTTDQIETNMLK